MAEHISAQLDFSGRVALVTGGASGIGRAVATQLVGLGARVVIADRNTEGAAAVAQKYGAERAVALTVDVADPDSVKAMTDEAMNRFGRLDTFRAGWID